jgi:uncharacterized protein (TIGR02266 family)
MFQISTEETFDDAQIIFEEGSHGDWVYVIESGRVEISKQVEGEKVVLGVLKPGEIFGEINYFTKTPRTATARAVGKTVVGLYDRSFLDEEFNKLSGSFRIMLTQLAIRLVKTTEIAALALRRRKDPRIQKVLSLSFRNRDDLVKALSENVSGEGMFIKTSLPLGKGERFFLKLQLPGAFEPLRIGCEVMWIRTTTTDQERDPVGMGIRFIQINHEDHRLLMDVIGKS